MSLTVQLQTMLAMIAMGGWIGASVDTYARLIRHRDWYKWVTVINDGLFWIFQSLLVFYVLLQVNEGEMRFYILLALLCGYAAYRAVLQNAFKKALENTIIILVKTYILLKNVVMTLIINPTKVLLKLLQRLCIMVLSGVLAILFFLGRLLLMPFLFIWKKLLIRFVNLSKFKRFYKKGLSRLRRIFVKK